LSTVVRKARDAPRGDGFAAIEQVHEGIVRHVGRVKGVTQFVPQPALQPPVVFVIQATHLLVDAGLGSRHVAYSLGRK
jgi:hypothetical protein